MDDNSFYIENPEFDLEKACKQARKIPITPFEGAIIFCLVGALLAKVGVEVYEKIFEKQPVVKQQPETQKIDSIGTAKFQNYITNPANIRVFQDKTSKTR